MNHKPFTQTLRYLRRGTLDGEIGRQLQALTKACRDTGKLGELTIKLKLRPGKSGQIEIDDDVILKLPKPEVGSTLMFSDDEGDLSRSHPEQGELPGLREVTQPSSDAPLRQVGGA